MILEKLPDIQDTGAKSSKEKHKGENDASEKLGTEQTSSSRSEACNSTHRTPKKWSTTETRNDNTENMGGVSKKQTWIQKL